MSGVAETKFMSMSTGADAGLGVGAAGAEAGPEGALVAATVEAISADDAGIAIATYLESNEPSSRPGTRVGVRGSQRARRLRAKCYQRLSTQITKQAWIQSRPIRGPTDWHYFCSLNVSRHVFLSCTSLHATKKNACAPLRTCAVSTKRKAMPGGRSTTLTPNSITTCYKGRQNHPQPKQRTTTHKTGTHRKHCQQDSSRRRNRGSLVEALVTSSDRTLAT